LFDSVTLKFYRPSNGIFEISNLSRICNNLKDSEQEQFLYILLTIFFFTFCFHWLAFLCSDHRPGIKFQKNPNDKGNITPSYLNQRVIPGTTHIIHHNVTDRVYYVGYFFILQTILLCSLGYQCLSTKEKLFRHLGENRDYSLRQRLGPRLLPRLFFCHP
jgi:hypothetical protein